MGGFFMGYLMTVDNPMSIITAIEGGSTFPNSMYASYEKYDDEIQNFIQFINTSSSSEEILHRIRSKEIPSEARMTYLKLFRRCIAPVCDTEMTKKITKVKTEDLIANYGHTFKDIVILRKEFAKLSADELKGLAMLIGEYDDRGQLGYELTNRFFTWFENLFGKQFKIDGPRGAGKDIQLCNVISDFKEDCPCDFIISDNFGKAVAIGFARYDSTRGGAQSDDRTGGNEAKVYKLKNYSARTGNSIKIIFLADGPGLAHKDTWEAARQLDSMWDDNVRVTTLKTAPIRITADWLRAS
jgi:hypothetical protein